MATLEQLGIAYNKAVADNNIEVANEIASAMNKATASAESPAGSALVQKVAPYEVQDIPQDVGLPQRNQLGVYQPTGFQGETSPMAPPFTLRMQEEMAGATKEVATRAPTFVASMAMAPAAVGYGAAIAVPAAVEVAMGLVRDDAPADITANAAFAAMTPGFKPKEAASFLGAAGKNFLQDLGVLSSATIASETLRGLLAGEDASSSLKNTFSLQNAVMIPALSFGGGILRAFGDHTSYLSRRAKEAADELRPLFLADAKVTPGLADPQQFAAYEAHYVRNNPDSLYAKNMKLLGDTYEKRWTAMFPEVERGADIAQTLEPMMIRAAEIRKQRDALVSLQKTRDGYVAKLAEMQQMGAPEAELNAIRSKIYAEQMAEVNQRARINLFEQDSSLLAGAGTPSSKVQQDFTDSVNETFRIRGEQADAMYKESGVKFGEKFIPVNSLITAVRRRLSKEDGSYVNSIVSTIKKEGGKSGFISLNQMRLMRGLIGSEFNSTDQNAIDAFDRVANIAYGAITAQSSNAVRRQFGNAAADKVAEVNKWWGNTANISSSKRLKAVLGKEPSEKLPEMLAGKMIDGEFGSFEKYSELINEISKYAPGVADSGRRAMTDLLRHGMILNATERAGNVNVAKLYEGLNGAATFLKKSKMMPIEQLGFGNAEQIRNIYSTFRKYDLKNLSPQEMEEFYANPLVRQDIAAGGRVAKAYSPAAAKIAFERRVNQMLMQEAAGMKADDRATKGLVQLAKEAGIEIASVKDEIRRLDGKNPIVRLFADPGTTIGTTLDPNQVSDVTRWMQQMPTDTRGKFFNVIKERNKTLADQIKDRIVVDLLGNVVKASPSSEKSFGVDIKAIQKIFDSGLRDKESPVFLLKQLLDPHEFERFKSKLPSFSRLLSYNSYQDPEKLGFDVRNILGGGVASLGGFQRQNLARSWVSIFGDAARGFKYWTASAAINDGEIANFLASGGRGAISLEKALIINSNKELMAENPGLEGIINARLGRKPSINQP